MKLTLLLIFLISFSAQATLTSRLDTSYTDQIVEGDQLVSALGRFRLTLLDDCKFKIQEFRKNDEKFVDVGRYELEFEEPRKSEENCKLNISTGGKSISSEKNKYIIGDKDKNYTRFSFFIDDFGKITLLRFLQQELETVIQPSVLQNLNKNDPLLFQALPNGLTVTNKNQWNFDVSDDQLTISKDNHEKVFKLNGLNSNYSGIYDGDGQPLRYSSLPGITLHPRAASASLQCSPEFKGPFVYEVDENYPILRVYDNNKYQILQFALDQSDMPINFCPQLTFEFDGKCVSKCPQIYYKEIRANKGKCVLNCEFGSMIDADKRICSSNNDQPYENFNKNKVTNRTCPQKSQEYEFGCHCTTQTSFYNQISNRCVSQNLCPNQTVGIDGICMKCPMNCLQCKVDQEKRSFLSCSEDQCEPPYIEEQGVCLQQQCQQNCEICEGIVCKQCAPFYFLINDQCSKNCPEGWLRFINNGGRAFCQVPTEEKSPNNFVTGVHNNKPFALILSCPEDSFRYLDKCIKTCPTQTKKEGDRCVCSNPNHRLLGNLCQQVKNPPPGMYFDPQHQLYLNCPIGCLNCNKENCLSCSPGYLQIVTGSGSVCRKNNPQIVCDSDYYTYDNDKKVCSVKTKFTGQHTECDPEIANCDICFSKKCVHCEKGYYLHENKCLKNCPDSYQVYRGVCVKKIDNCDKFKIKKVVNEATIDSQIVDGEVYGYYTKNGEEGSVDPLGDIFMMRKQLSLPPSQAEYKTAIYEGEPQCLFCEKGYRLQNNECIKCGINEISVVDNCVPCVDLFAVDNECKKEDNCQQNEVRLNGTCQECPAGLVKVDGENKCENCKDNQIYENKKCKPCGAAQIARNNECKCLFRRNNKCHESCSAGDIPKISGFQIQCIPQSRAQPEDNALRIDASVYKLDNEVNGPILFYFILSQLIATESQSINFTFTTVGSQRRLLAEGSEKTKAIQDKSYLGFITNEGEDEGYIDFRNKLLQLKSLDGSSLGSGIYGTKLSESHSDNSETYLSIIAKILSIVLIIIHAIYIGNNLIYKVDNIMIFAQTIFFFSFVHLLVGVPIAQFFNGFLWSHWGFYPNYFQQTIPQGYVEGFAEKDQTPNPYKLLTIDANFIRNGGFAFSLLLTFLVVFGLVVLVLMLLKEVGKKYEVWYSKIAKDALIAAFQFLSMAIMYWATAHLLYNMDPLEPDYFSNNQNLQLYQRPNVKNHDSFRTSCSIAAVIFVILIPIYAIARFCFNSIGGLYMCKRVIIAVILAGSTFSHFTQEVNGEELAFGSKRELLAALSITELVFVILRFVVEKPFGVGKVAMIIVQGVLMFIGYLLLYLWTDAGVTSIYISIVLLIFIILLIEDLIDVYNDARDEFYDEDIGIVPGVMQQIPDTERNG